MGRERPGEEAPPPFQRVVCAALRPLPSANLWGVCVDMPPLWGLYIRPVPHFKERA